MEQIGAHRGQNRLHAVEPGLLARGHDGQCATLGSGDTARHRRIDKSASRLLHTRGYSLDAPRRAGAHDNHSARGFQRLECAFGEQHVLGLVRIDHHEYEHVGILGRDTGAIRAAPARILQRLDGLLAHVIADNAHLLLDKVLGHGAAHGAEPDEGDPLCHGLSLFVLRMLLSVRLRSSPSQARPAPARWRRRLPIPASCPRPRCG